MACPVAAGIKPVKYCKLIKIAGIQKGSGHMIKFGTGGWRAIIADGFT